MKTLLQICRHDGKRYWIKNSDGRWIVTQQKWATVLISMAKGIHKSKVTKLREEIKFLSKRIKDPKWAEAVDWQNFTKGCLIFTGGAGTVELCDRNGNSKRSMKIADFNKILKDRFPSKKKVSEDAPACCLLSV